MSEKDRLLFHQMLGRLRVLEKVATYHFMKAERMDRETLTRELHGLMVSFYMRTLGGDCGNLCPDGEGGCVECN